MSCLNCGGADHLACARFVSGPAPKRWRRNQRWSEALFWLRVVGTVVFWLVLAVSIGGILALVLVPAGHLF